MGDVPQAILLDNTFVDSGSDAHDAKLRIIWIFHMLTLETLLLYPHAGFEP
jgi:hypothetical protein